MSKRTANNERTLLSTVTGEPFQPVRLYYAIPSRSAVTKVFARLRCLDEDKDAGCWVWLYEREAAALKFGHPRERLPAEVHPIVIGRFKLDKDRMVLAVRSNERAIQAAKFFKPLLGPKVVLIRARIINRWFDVREAAVGLERLDELLDADVTVIDPKDAEEKFEKAMSGTTTPAQKLKALTAYREARSRRDAPLVEDFPLHADEETPDFRDLKFTLELRMVHAFEHWRGNTHVTLADILHRLVEGSSTHACSDEEPSRALLSRFVADGPCLHCSRSRRRWPSPARSPCSRSCCWRRPPAFSLAPSSG